jgi:hypothetical protein
MLPEDVENTSPETIEIIIMVSAGEVMMSGEYNMSSILTGIIKEMTELGYKLPPPHRVAKLIMIGMANAMRN